MGAAGIWQLMPGTASDFGIKRNNWYDGRRDVIVSTRGALNYLAYLQRFFEGHWLLAIAAYNTGEGNVMSALRRNIQDGKDTDFWSLPLAQQTKDYVPSLLALAVIISHPDQYPIPFPPVQNAPYLAQVDVSTQINMKYAASLAGITYDRISQLNPGINSRTTAGKAPSKLVIPIENVEQFTKNVAMLPNSPRLMLTSLARKIKSTTAIAAHYVLQPGDTIYMVRMKDTIDKISKRFNVRKDALVQANALQNKQITPGKQLIIPTHQTTTASASPTKTMRAGDTVYMVRRGDTIDSIASRYKTTASVIRLTNLIDDSSLMEGQRIVIPTKLRG
jgi:membrane-bound lytic murein transglycosylase D